MKIRSFCKNFKNNFVKKELEKLFSDFKIILSIIREIIRKILRKFKWISKKYSASFEKNSIKLDKFRDISGKYLKIFQEYLFLKELWKIFREIINDFQVTG